MAIRTSEEEVTAVVEVSSSLSVLPFIDIASSLTDKVEACAIARNHTLSVVQLRGIETYLTAYFYVGRDPRYKSKKTQDASAEFVVPDYWDMAVKLDTSGCLDGFGKIQHFAQLNWLGTPKSSQTAYEDRD